MKKAPYQITRARNENGSYRFCLRDTRDMHIVLVDSYGAPVPPKSMLAIQAKLNTAVEVQLLFG